MPQRLISFSLFMITVVAWLFLPHTAAAQTPATVTIAHFAPFAADVDDTTVTVRIRGVESITELTFGDTADNVEVPPGEYLVDVVSARSNATIVREQVTFNTGIDYTLAVIGDGRKRPFELSVAVDDNRALTRGGRIRFSHFAPIAELLRNTDVDICFDDGRVAVNGLRYRDVTRYFELDAAEYDMTVAVGDTSCQETLLDLPPFTIADGSMVEIAIIGNQSDQRLAIATTMVTDVAELAADALIQAEEATVTIAHFAPFADTAADTSVTVRINGVTVLTDFTFGETVTDLALPAGRYVVQLIPSGASDSILSDDLVLRSGEQYTLAATGDNQTVPLELFVLRTAVDAPTRGGRVRFVHLAPLATTAEATAVDICTDDNDIVLRDLRFADVTDYLSLPADEYALHVAPSGARCADVAATIPTFRVTDGDVRELFVIGGQGDLDLQAVINPPVTIDDADTTAPDSAETDTATDAEAATADVDVEDEISNAGDTAPGDAESAPADDVSFTVEVANIAPEPAVTASGVFTMAVDAGENRVARPGDAYEFTFNARPGQRLSFATMFVQSNDWFFAPDAAGIALFSADGTPVEGDVTAQILLYDAGTEADAAPGAGVDQAPRQFSSDSGAADPIRRVRRVKADLPAIAAMIRVTLTATGPNEFTARIENRADAPTLRTPDGESAPLVLSPGVYVVHERSAPLFNVGLPDRGHGLEALAEDGAPGQLQALLASASGIETQLSSGVYVVHTDANPLFTADEPAPANGLEALVEDGNPRALAEELAREFDASGMVAHTEGADPAQPLAPGKQVTFTLTADPGDALSFALMLVQSNDLFLAPAGAGIPLFDADGAPSSGDVTESVLLWDAGTEENEPYGLGPNQASRQSAVNQGEDEAGVVQIASDAGIPPVAEVIRVTISPTVDEDE